MTSDFPSRPPMGWNSWDCYGAGVNEERFLANARFMADRLLEHGYEYAVIDIEWSEPGADSTAYHHFEHLYMDEYCRLIPAPERFPSSAGGKGFKPIADKVHAMGLKFGIHIMRGIPRQAVYSGGVTASGAKASEIASQGAVCPWNSEMYGVKDTPAGQAYYDSLFELYASWDVDFIKCDDICVTEGSCFDRYSGRHEIEMLRSAIDRCGRPMVLSLSPGPASVDNAAHLSLYANMWRLTGDFWDEWSALEKMFDVTEKWYPWTAPGNYPDCDMLPVGMLSVNDPANRHRSRFTKAELGAMMTLWCVFRSPLMIGGELTMMNDEELRLLTDDYLLGFDLSGSGARPLMPGCVIRAWRVRDADGRECLALFNTGDSDEEYCLENIPAFGRYFSDFAYSEYTPGEGFSPEKRGKTVNICKHSAKIIRFCE